MAPLSQNERQVVRNQVARAFAHSEALQALSASQRASILGNTAAIVEELAGRRSPDAAADPYRVARAQAAPPGEFKAEAVAAGVTQAARMVNEINFPAFVASLIEGTFHSIVKSSIEQMQAYAEMVKSVAMSLNDFRDQNVTDNQARDNLASRYPSVFQLQINEGKPKLGLRDDFDGTSPNFQKDLGMAEDPGDVDEDMIEQKLVPAARDDLARNRQQLLATVILMGINRIIVTDGKINAKVRFQFSAQDSVKRQAIDYDYQQYGDVVTAQNNYESNYEGATYDKDGATTKGRTSYAKGAYQYASVPNVKVTSQVQTDSQGNIQASGQIMGEVTVNFRSETFPLEKMVNTDQMMQLNQAQRGAGRSVPATPTQTTTAAAPSAATTPPATPPPAT